MDFRAERSAISCGSYIALMLNKWNTLMKHLWNIIAMGKPKCAETNISLLHFFHHKPHMERADVKTDPPDWNAGDLASVWSMTVPACNHKSRNYDDIRHLFVYLYVMKVYDGADVPPQLFLISKWSASHPYQFAPTKESLVPIDEETVWRPAPVWTLRSKGNNT